MDYLIKLKQFQIETDYHNEVNNRLHVEFNTIDETEESTYKYNDDIPDDVVYTYVENHRKPLINIMIWKMILNIHM